MRHRKHHHQLGAKSAHRQALLARLASDLINHGKITTTLSKAKALRPFVEKIITLAKKANTPGVSPERALHLRRLAIARIRDKQAVRTLFNEKAEQFLNRPGGYTRIYKLGFRRGDAAEIALIQLISADDPGYEKHRKSKKQQDKVLPPTPKVTPVTQNEEKNTAASAAEDTPVKVLSQLGTEPNKTTA